MKKLLPAGFLLSSVILVLLLIVYTLFKAYPAENANSGNLISRGGLLLAFALSGLIATGSLLLLRYTQGKKDGRDSLRRHRFRDSRQFLSFTEQRKHSSWRAAIKRVRLHRGLDESKY